VAAMQVAGGDEVGLGDDDDADFAGDGAQA
jgi:hypothetical protein